MSHEPSQLESLGRDVPYLADLLRGRPEVLASALKTSDPYERCLRLAVVDLFFQVQQHAAAVHALSHHSLMAPLMVAHRALYECFLSVQYIANHPEKNFEATVLLAWSYIKDVEELFGGHPAVEERTRLLAAMPQDAVETAAKRMAARPFTWTGLNVRTVAKQSRVGGYDEFYGPISSYAHSARVGRYFRISPSPAGGWSIGTGWEMAPAEREVQANQARRLLFASFRSIWSLLGGGRLDIDAFDPFAWSAPEALQSERPPTTPSS